MFFLINIFIYVLFSPSNESRFLDWTTKQTELLFSQFILFLTLKTLFLKRTYWFEIRW